MLLIFISNFYRWTPYTPQETRKQEVSPDVDLVRPLSIYHSQSVGGKNSFLYTCNQQSFIISLAKRLSTSARRLLWKKKLQVNFVYYNLWAFLSFFSPITGPRRQKKKRYSWITSKFIDFIGLYTSQPAEFLIHVYSRPHEKKWQFSNEFDWSRR